MSAAPIDLPRNAPADVERRPDPVWVPGTEYLVPSFYDGRWHNQNFDAPVMYEGRPIECNGEVLTVAKVPPWRRYALRDDSAEALPQEVFARRKTMADQEYIFEKSDGKSNLAFPEKEPIPAVREFLSWKRHPGEPDRLIPLGVSHERQPAKLSQRIYDEVSRNLVSFSDLPQTTQAQMIAEIQKAGGDPTPPAPVAPIEPAVQKAVKRTMAASAAPCGRELKSKAGAMAHARSCIDCQAIENPAPVEGGEAA